MRRAFLPLAAVLLAIAAPGPAAIAAPGPAHAAGVAVHVLRAPAVRQRLLLGFRAGALPEHGYYYAVVVLEPRGRYTKASRPSCSTSSDMQRTDYGYPNANGEVRLALTPATSRAGRWCRGGVYEGAIYAVPHAPPCESAYPCRAEPYEPPSPCWNVEGHQVCGLVALPRRWSYPHGLPAPLAGGTAIVARFSIRFPSAPARTSRVCRAPRLVGVTVDAARRRAARAGCALRLEGAALEDSAIQTVERQSPPPGRRARRAVAVWVNPLCRGMADYDPDFHEPSVRPGPTRLLAGFYLVGGPVGARFSSPRCTRPEPPPGAGVVEVLDTRGMLLAKRTSTFGHLVEVPLPPGVYLVRGTFLGATINDVHPTTTTSLTVPAGDTVRQDFFLSIP